ncbi:uncharacterized protein PADG_12396 [Paracoccidioides brasiliensis Pb18]|uniref:Uncharacterized protein n=1 Tax=Paracoccidioides brasiliensis (strain Pb18) TaxID=502780 RepID=A0A0A0HTA3_PARBD|nr:uncharacterized protein PADG_12396 [Paracoccidioides brasiliensis Pb18]KGM91538.1 hypothetical protein PADG_12396 [Paracoccidioides brasiliensis Pb18]
MTSQQTQKALVDGPNGEPLVITDYPIPPLLADYVLAKTAYVSLNPLHQAHWLAATSQGRSKRDRGEKIMGFNHGINRVRPTTGSFSEHVITKGDLPFRVPESLPMDQAATMPVGLYTVGQGLYQGILRLA